jgi:hypothetical protein
MSLSKERAERIARAHACVGCREYTWRKLTVREASRSLQEEFGEVWHATLVCGVCGVHQELGIDDDGDVVYVA